MIIFASHVFPESDFNGNIMLKLCRLKAPNSTFELRKGWRCHRSEGKIEALQGQETKCCQRQMEVNYA